MAGMKVHILGRRGRPWGREWNAVVCCAASPLLYCTGFVEKGIIATVICATPVILSTSSSSAKFIEGLIVELYMYMC